MAPKIAFIIVCLGTIATVLLATRQQRLQTVYDTARIEGRIRQLQREEARLRVELVRLAGPPTAEAFLESLGPPGEETDRRDRSWLLSQALLDAQETTW